jgi:hypothetical protein
MQLPLHCLGRATTDTGRKMHLAPLPARALELNTHGGGEATMMVGDDQIHVGEAAALEPGEEVRPAALRLAIPQLQAQDLAAPLFVDPGRQQGAARAHPPVFAHLDDERIHEHEGVARAAQIALIPGCHERVEPLAQLGDRGLGELPPTQLFGDVRHFARGNAVDDHLHQRQDERLFTALVAGEELGGEATLAHLRDA